jgi:hypothetical protein
MPFLFVFLDALGNAALRGVLKIIVFGVMLGLGILCQKIYERYRRPDSAEFYGNWEVPGGRRAGDVSPLFHAALRLGSAKLPSQLGQAPDERRRGTGVESLRCLSDGIFGIVAELRRQ